MIFMLKLAVMLSAFIVLFVVLFVALLIVVDENNRHTSRADKMLILGDALYDEAWGLAFVFNKSIFAILLPQINSNSINAVILIQLVIKAPTIATVKNKHARLIFFIYKKMNNELIAKETIRYLNPLQPPAISKTPAGIVINSFST